MVEVPVWEVQMGVLPLGAGHPAAPGLMEAAKGLIVQIFNATCLVPSQQISPDTLQPYASYEVLGHKTHFTQTGTGANVSFEVGSFCADGQFLCTGR
ncbi:unnamed protein product [Cladocopium goreaui]|uniref:RPGR-interacting protein 1 first C2 domain-containing protein n=1 Tax=Cladocopium goreaui TaxID=2562237 RepID=A0A9P1GIZ1_9DINO|nr:unnamed protein product [Cladocopium goreaui]